MLKLLLIVLTGWAVTFGLRAFPFVLFAGNDRPLPPWVERLGAVVSPVIIAGLVIYSYSGLEWRTAWPYLAGALTVGLQLWKRNPLISILAGTAVYMTAVGLCGCVSVTPISVERRNPSLCVTTAGVRCNGEPVSPQEVPRLLRRADIPYDRTVHIQVSDVRNLSEARTVLGYLGQAGYSNCVLMTPPHADATNRKPSDGVSTRKRTFNAP